MEYLEVPLILILLIFFYEVLWPLYLYRDKETFLEKMIADEVEYSLDQKKTISERGIEAYGYGWYTMFFIAMIGGYMASIVGISKGTAQKGFMVFADLQNQAVIRKYNDKIIAMPFDRVTKTIEPRIIVLNIGANGIDLLIEPELGPLKATKYIK